MDMPLQEIENALLNLPHYPCGVTYQNLSRKKALLTMAENELLSIYYLSETHTPALRVRAESRYEQASYSTNEKPVTINAENIAVHCSKQEEQLLNMLQKIEEMPAEWTLVQITPKFNVQASLNMVSKYYFTPALHISVFSCGKHQPKPICVTVDKPKDVEGNVMEICQELNHIIQENKAGLTSVRQTHGANFKSFDDKQAYWKQRMALNYRLKQAIKTVQDDWLKAWKCLFIGKFFDSKLEDELNTKVVDFIQEFNLSNVSSKSKLLLKYLIKGASLLCLKEVLNALQEIFPDIDQVSERTKMLKSIKSISLQMSKAKRHPVILIVDDKLDFVPWEMINVLVDHPSSRMPSLTLTYALFKEHEPTIKNGLKTGIQSDSGHFILNPGLDLKNMEIRLHNFFKYWKPSWKGIVGKTPNDKEFESLLTSCDIFSYNGHGNGTQFLSSGKIEKIRVEGVVLLFGCGSVKLVQQGPNVEPIGSHQMYLIACSPCVLGMLWEVTDNDTDILTTEFLSLWLPSKAETPWKNIDKKKWESGEEIQPDTKKSFHENLENDHEPEILRALCKAKKSAKYYITQAACIARGLPLKVD